MKMHGGRSELTAALGEKLERTIDNKQQMPPIGHLLFVILTNFSCTWATIADASLTCDVRQIWPLLTQTHASSNTGFTQTIGQDLKLS